MLELTSSFIDSLRSSSIKCSVHCISTTVEARALIKLTHHSTISILWASVFAYVTGKSKKDHGTVSVIELL